MLALEEIAAQILGRLGVPCRSPWAPLDEAGVEQELRRRVEDLCTTFELQSRVEWSHYGSGYASYVEAWFYRPDDSFRREGPSPLWTEYTGLVVLLSRLGPAFCLMEGERCWTSGGTSGSNLPAFERVDAFESDVVRLLAGDVEHRLDEAGFARLRKEDLAALLPAEVEIETNLDEPPWREFDAVFHWFD